jgi:hypothetical protein
VSRVTTLLTGVGGKDARYDCRDSNTRLQRETIVDNLSEVFNPESNSFWNLLLAAAITIGSVIAARYVRRYIRRRLASYEGLADYAGAPVGRIAGWMVVFVGVIFALSVMGVDMVPVVLVIAVVVAFLVLSGQSMIQNWAAGLLLQARRPFRLGDRIESLGHVGYVEEVNVRSVVVRTGDGQIVHLPNADVLRNPLVNRTGEDGRRQGSPPAAHNLCISGISAVDTSTNGLTRGRLSVELSGAPGLICSNRERCDFDIESCKAIPDVLDVG